MAIAIFTSLKPMSGRDGENQSRSLANWQSVLPDCPIIRFEGSLIPFHDMVAQVEAQNSADIFIYSNADILFDETLPAAIASLMKCGIHTAPFLMTGQRIDILEDESKHLHRPSGMDWFVFRRGMFHDLPPTLMGRGYCDCALVSYCLLHNIPVVDASFCVRAEHQFHGYAHIKDGRGAAMSGNDAQANRRNNALGDFGPHCLDATHTLSADGSLAKNIRKRPRCWRLWNLATRGGKWWANPKWDGIKPI